jgi:PAS domain S-box-containing protein
MVALPGFTLSDKLYESPASLVYRGLRQADDLPVVVKVLRQDYPGPEEINRYRQEYEILRSLSLPGVIRAYDRIPYQHTYVIVFEDFGGESLSYWMRRWPNLYSPMTVADFLHLAITLTDTLDQLHQQHITHKDINPNNIVLNPSTGLVKLIDFGISTQLSRIEPVPAPPGDLEGTLAYLSPEQTGRMNRVIDYRTDFYSLGVTFYELLTGRLPFTSQDMLELVHCHLAQIPPAPTEMNPDIPSVLSDLVMKLMAKDAETRYQSAFGLKADLERCLTALQTQGPIECFPLGQQDFTGKLQIPQKLYGREVEVGQLLAAFERVGGVTSTSPTSPTSPTSTSELLLITGYSGIGKSSLVRELYSSITARRGYFISGKFDQYQRGVPYTALVDAFAELVRHLLGEGEVELQRWRDRMLTAVGSSGQVITDVLPDVQQIIGPQPPLPELGPVETQNRFNYVFKNFIRCCCLPEHPLTLFLDDLQWADQASLNLLQQVLMDEQMHHLLVLGAYRNNEVDEHHPLSATLQTLTHEGVRVQTLTLMPLGMTHLGQLLSDTLHQPVEAIAELTGLILQKTTGNPFFVTQFLKTLHSQEFLAFNGEQRCWQWDIDRIQAANCTDNVVELMADDIQQLPQSTQQLLQLAACIGTEFELSPLEMLTDRTAATFLTDLAIATAKGLLISSGGQRSYWQTNRYRFVHDRIQQTVYEMDSAEHHQQIHLRLGQWLWEQVADSEAPERLFEIVDHLNLGLLNHQRFTAFSWAERQQWAELNLKAGRKAKESMAYLAAADYLKAGLTLLGATAWEKAYPLAMALHEEAAETAYLSGNFARMTACIEAALTHSLAPLDQVKSYNIKIRALASQGQLPKAIAAGLDILAELGVNLPRNPDLVEMQSALDSLKTLLDGYTCEDLLARPETTNPQALAAIQMLANITASAYVSAPALLPIVVYKIVELSLQEGYAPASPVGYSTYGGLLCSMPNQIDRGYQFGQLAARLVSRLGVSQLQPRVLLALGGHIAVWKEPLAQHLSTLRAAYESGIETGDFEFAGYALNNLSVNVYFSGQPLEVVIDTLQTYANNARQIRQRVAQSWLSTYLQAAINLTGVAEEAIVLAGPAYDERTALEAAQQRGNLTELHHIYLNKLILCYLLGEYDQALACAQQAGTYVGAVIAMLSSAMFHFYNALVQLAGLRLNTHSAANLTPIDDSLNKLQNWANHAPMKFQHKVDLVRAEKARVLGQLVEAEDYYEQAIAGAQANGYQQELALAYELAASFYRQRGRELFANTYLKEAHYAYALWGAQAKVRQLEAQFPQVLAESPAAPAQPEAKITHPSFNSGNVTSQQLDLQAIFQATRAIAGAIEIPRLQSTLLEILLKGAGAQRGYLLLPSETATDQTEWWIEATGQSDILNSLQGGISVEVLQQLPMTDHVPVSLVNYVLHTQKSVVLDDACQRNDFSGDAYLRSHPTRSLLCTPILNRGVQVGLVYLENNLTVGAFTRDRLEMVQLLAGQAAISLSNARLYSQLRDREAQVRQSEQRVKQFLDAIPVGISVFDQTGHFAYQNLKAQELQGMVAANDTTVDQLTDVFQVYKADSDQPYSTAELPVVRALAGEKIRVEDVELRRGDRTLPLEVSATPILNDVGEVLYAIAAFDDITERKQAQKLLTDYSRTLETEVEERTEALTRQWDLLQTLVNQIPTMLAFYDAGGDLILVNRAVEEMTGWSIAELSQTAWLEQIYPDPDYRQAAWEHWEAADSTWLDRTLRCRDGHCIETTWAHIRLSDGRKIGIGRDITERKRMEESLRSQAEEERLLATITQHIRQSLNLTDILNTTVVEVQRNLNADRVLILKFCDDGVVRVIQALATEAYRLPNTLNGMPDCALKECYDHCLQGQPRIFSSADATSCLESLMQTLGVQSEVVAPIIYPSNELKTPSPAYIWGLLMVQSCQHPRQWQNSEADFLQQISNQLAIGIYQSDLYHQLEVELVQRRQAEAALRQSESPPHRRPGHRPHGQLGNGRANRSHDLV